MSTEEEGQAISYGDALKAFRRGVYMFPDQWKAVVVCMGTPQLRYAFSEAAKILEASSLKVEGIRQSESCIDVERGGHLRFVMVEGVERRVQGWNVPHFIVPATAVPDRAMEVMRCTNRHPEIQDRYLRFDRVYL